MTRYAVFVYSMSVEDQETAESAASRLEFLIAQEGVQAKALFMTDRQVEALEQTAHAFALRDTFQRDRGNIGEVTAPRHSRLDLEHD